MCSIPRADAPGSVVTTFCSRDTSEPSVEGLFRVLTAGTRRMRERMKRPERSKACISNGTWR